MNLTILGATGSIGQSTLDVVGRHPDRYRVFALGALRQHERLAEQCLRFAPRYAVLADEDAARVLRERLATAGCGTEVLTGPRALVEVAAAAEVDAVMAAIVGAAGLEAAIAAGRAGKRILLANKESLVMAGEVFLSACASGGAAVLPIDSEHNAVFQCLPGGRADGPGIRRILLTASGGPFRRASLAEMAKATPEQACAHPNWSMGRKISVDSATMMNKGLELIEAHYLFGLPGSRLEVVVHPQSIVHSLVEYADGSMLAQLGNPDMRTPIAHALAHPERIDSGVAPLELARIGRLDFEEPDMERFPCLGLAHQALDAGGGAPCVLNAANEVAVEAFLARRIAFTGIAELNARVLDALGARPAGADVDSVLALDRDSRRAAAALLEEVAA
ncbi:1-deoxy-D-xylulose-5-phosphate reductoisomerase [Burkholderiaceae bacterium FT117]|uniref:1-deoxy-D-xylulose-5-phosphate reductoisomerase n=1 Tax=Zeimonas sediminis TaxID=2944268 RepID=UPI00234313FA|nr:1-deoxy-D-xylulose-5-phosphate reductoisomerase [Zeimonas sediminis]MCM5569190.1 1-deoxy-D-xylulose-5-phosphate reductoisomerase [Zeimonas sediminis]